MVRSQSTSLIVEISKFLPMVVFLIYHGASTIVLRALFWTTWIILRLVLALRLQAAAP